MSIHETETITAAEQRLIDKASGAVANSNWTIGQCAHEWCEKYGTGRTDRDFAELIGSTQQTVNFARRVYARFYSRGSKLQCSWREWKSLLPEDEQQLDESISVLLSDDGVPHDYEHLMMLHRARTGQPEPTAAAGLTGADIPPSETPIATPREEATESARATKPERQSTAKVGPEPVEEEVQTPERGKGPAASSADSRPKTSTSTLSGDSITDPPIVRWDQIGVDFPQIGQAFAAIVRLPMTDEERRKMVRLVETELLRKLKQLLPEDEKPKAAKRFKPPTLEQVREYCQERGNSVDPEAWMDFYTSKGWMVGKNKMKDWKAAVRTWEKSDRLDKSDLARVRGTDWSEYDD